MKKNKKGAKIFGFAIGLLTGVACGIVLFGQLDFDMPLWQYIGQLLLALLAFYAMIVAQIAIHEAGHLVAGLLSGYRFVSYRLFGLMWIRKDGRIRLKRFSLAGTGGQCLMDPPDMREGALKTTLYNLGGVLANLLTAALALGMSFFVQNAAACALLRMFAVVGFSSVLINGIPMRAINNDGANALDARRSEATRRAFWVQLKMNAYMAQGIRLKDMPAEWFEMPADDALNDMPQAAMGVLVCNRLMDEMRFDEAEAQIEHMLEKATGMAQIHRRLLILDDVYLRLLNGEDVSELLDASTVAFMKQMADYPSVLRTRYARALLQTGDRAAAEKLQVRFDKVAARYPYSADIEAERALMDAAKAESDKRVKEENS